MQGRSYLVKKTKFIFFNVLLLMHAEKIVCCSISNCIVFFSTGEVEVAAQSHRGGQWFPFYRFTTERITAFIWELSDSYLQRRSHERSVNKKYLADRWPYIHVIYGNLYKCTQLYCTGGTSEQSHLRFNKWVFQGPVLASTRFSPARHLQSLNRRMSKTVGESGWFHFRFLLRR